LCDDCLGHAGQVLEPLTVARLVLEATVVDRVGSDLPDAVRGGVSRGLAEIDKAHDTLRRFMEIAHPEATAMEQPVGLYQIARRTMSVFADVAQRHGLTIAVKDMDIVPLMAMSPREVEQIFYHLIQRATNDAVTDVDRRLVISCAAGEGHIDLVFHDVCGQTQPEQSEHASEVLLGDLDADRSTGLGLAIAKRIVADHGGQIYLDAGPGYATFRIRLPVKRVY
jgi:signal transduction histidine kinase